jgi:hypothetical protein
MEAAAILKGNPEEDPKGSEVGKLVDLADQLDPDLASSVAADLDDDEGRRRQDAELVISV